MCDLCTDPFLYRLLTSYEGCRMRESKNEYNFISNRVLT